MTGAELETESQHGDGAQSRPTANTARPRKNLCLQFCTVSLSTSRCRPDEVGARLPADEDQRHLFKELDECKYDLRNEQFRKWVELHVPVMLTTPACATRAVNEQALTSEGELRRFTVRDTRCSRFARLKSAGLSATHARKRHQLICSRKASHGRLPSAK